MQINLLIKGDKQLLTINILRITNLISAICVVVVEMGFCHVAQAGLKLLGSRDPPTLASQVQ